MTATIEVDVKKELIKILRAFDSFCKQEEITYYLGYGSVLGAVRHKGFIPWDDDVDVILNTTEYYKIHFLAQKNRYIDDKKRYRIILPGDKDYCYSFIKIIDTKYVIREPNVHDRFNIGLFIDVFRVDFWPETKFRQFIQLKYARFLLKVNEVLIRGNIPKGSRYYIIDKVIRPIDILFSLVGLKPEAICKRLEKQGSKNKKNSYVGNIMSGSGRKSEKLDAGVFDAMIPFEFEGELYPIPQRYDDYLRSLYGDYMVLPEETKRIGHEYNIISVDRMID